MRAALFFAALLGSTTLAQAVPLFGINDSGLEFGSAVIPGKANTNFASPSPAYYLGLGVKVVRVPYQIRRLQSAPGAALTAAYLGYLQGIASADTAGGAVTVIDPHGFGTIGSEDITIEPGTTDYIDHISRVAEAFAGQPKVALGLMNEPHQQSDAAYLPVWNAAITAIRAAGFTGVVVVPRTAYSSPVGMSAASPFPIVDPLKNWVLEIHCYPDPDDSGTFNAAIASATVGSDRLAGAIAWSKASGVKLFLGEFGTPSDAASIAALHSMYATINANPGVFWGAGPWWATTYKGSLHER